MSENVGIEFPGPYTMFMGKVSIGKVHGVLKKCYTIDGHQTH